MTMDLSNQNLSNAKNKLSKYISVRKEKSQRIKLQNDDDEDV